LEAGDQGSYAVCRCSNGDNEVSDNLFSLVFRIFFSSSLLFTTNLYAMDGLGVLRTVLHDSINTFMYPSFATVEYIIGANTVVHLLKESVKLLDKRLPFYAKRKNANDGVVLLEEELRVWDEVGVMWAVVEVEATLVDPIVGALVVAVVALDAGGLRLVVDLQAFLLRVRRALLYQGTMDTDDDDKRLTMDTLHRPNVDI
jgi:hypothetical protein